MRRVRSVVGLAAALGAAVTSVLPAQPRTNDRFDAVRGAIHRYLDSTGVASMAVAVAKDGKIIWEEGFGWADRERMRPANPNTMYSLASISKPFTATGLMVLVGRGQVELDRPINQYLGQGKLTGLAGDANQATVRRVLSHTSGLPLHYQFFYADQSYGPPTMDETISRYGNLVFAPGTVYEYSNLGFGIIDHVIERVSGRTYPDFMRAEVFLPLGLTHTSVDVPPALEPFAAVRYDGHQRPIPFYTFDHMGASAVWASAHDLVRFGMFHLEDHLKDQVAILPDSLIDAMHQPVAPAAYGLGFGIQDDLGYHRVSHTGGMPGVATVMNLYPEENLAIVVLTNASARPNAIAQEIAAVMLPHYGDSLAARRSAARPPAPPPFTPPATLVGEWSGSLRTWQRTVPLRLSVRPDGDIFVWLDDQPRAVANQVRFVGNRLTGRFAGRIPTDDAGRWPHSVQLGLLLVDGRLEGQVSAQTGGDPVYFSLASYAKLQKSSP